MTSRFPLQFVCFSVPRHLPMKHDLLAVVVDFNNGITPAEIGIQMIEPNRHLHCHRRGVKPSSICRYHRRSPLPLHLPLELTPGDQRRISLAALNLPTDHSIAVETSACSKPLIPTRVINSVPRSSKAVRIGISIFMTFTKGSPSLDRAIDVPSRMDIGKPKKT